MKTYYIVILFIVPLIMVASGVMWRKSGPKKINKAFGYRTARSMKSLEAWQFAHRYVGRLWYYCGAALAAASLVCWAVFGRGSAASLPSAATAMIFVQMVVMLLTIPVTERQLKQNFDDQGRMITRPE